MNHVSLVLSLLYAVKINDYYLYGACLSKMVGLFSALMVKIMPDVSATSRCSWSTLRKLTRAPPSYSN